MSVRQRQHGIGVYGLIAVIAVASVVTALVTPLLLPKYKRATEDADRQALESARTSIIGYIMTNGKLPTPDAASARCPVGVMPANLGVNNWGQFGRENPFCMDTNTALRGTTTPKALCAAARGQLITPAAPYVDTAPAAFVLYSTGKNRGGDLRNAGTTRVYEPDNRGIDDSAGASHYDDQVVSYPLSSLLTECAKLGGAPVCNLNASPTTITLGASATLTASCSNTPNCATPYTWSSSPVPPQSGTLPSGSSTSGTVMPSAAGTYTYSVTGCNEFGTGPIATATVTVTAPSSLISNGNFASNNVGGGYAYSNWGLVAAPWTFSGGSGLSANNTAWGGSAASLGSNYFAFIQNSPAVISQTIGAVSGQLTISFYLAQRVTYGCQNCQEVAVTFDGIPVTGSPFRPPPAGGAWRFYSVTVNASNAAQHTLSFSGTYPGPQDATVFLANVSITSP